MSGATKQKRAHAMLRAHRTRTRIRGTADCPRLTVKRSLKHIYAQLIDDEHGVTLASASDASAKATGKPVDIASAVGKQLAETGTAKGISKAVFDRGSYRYHGRVAALADGARAGGLTF